MTIEEFVKILDKYNSKSELCFQMADTVFSVGSVEELIDVSTPIIYVNLID